MLNKKAIIISFIVLIIPNGCNFFNSGNNKNNQQVPDNTQKNYELNKLLKAKIKAVYLEYDTLDNFGKIIAIDLENKEKVNVVDSEYFNSSPIWINDGNGILFPAARIGKIEELEMVGGSAWKQLYYLDLINMNINKVFDDEEQGGGLKISDFIGLCWNPDLKEIYFSNKDNKIYGFSIDDNEIKIINNYLEEDERIENIELSGDKKFLAIEYFKFDLNTTFGIYILNLSNKEVPYSYEGHMYSLLGWSLENFPLVYWNNQVFEINFETDSLKMISLNLDFDKLRIDKIIAESDSSLIMLVNLIQTDPKTGVFTAYASEIGRYFIKLGKLEWLTNDGHKKSNLDIFIKE